jgi:hypothetical protein
MQALQEMRRVTRKGGAILAIAEPDYGGRIDHPSTLVELGLLQQKALEAQGADPLAGRKLSGLFHQAGLVRIETGLLGGQWSKDQDLQTWQSEWSVLEADLHEMVPSGLLEDLRANDRSAWEKGERVLFVPTFYAIGFVP